MKVLLISALLLQSCKFSGTSFSGSEKSPATPAKTEAPPPSPTAAIGNPSPTPSCQIDLNYNPASVDCSIAISDTNSVWSHTPPWSKQILNFRDKGAFWISPLAQTTSSNGFPACPPVAGEKLIYVSWFQAASAGSHSVEAFNDNDGKVRLWKNSDPSQQVLEVASGSDYAVTPVNLTADRYAIVVDSVDQGIASAIVLSITGPSGSVVKRTTKDGSWCVFRVPLTVDIKDYVPKAAACRPCFGITR